jgi:hypothetical protein
MQRNADAAHAGQPLLVQQHDRNIAAAVLRHPRAPRLGFGSLAHIPTGLPRCRLLLRAGRAARSLAANIRDFFTERIDDDEHSGSESEKGS